MSLQKKKQISLKHTDRDYLFSRIPGWDVNKVRNARVMVVGAGALGNEVLKNLALLNIQQIVIIDFDFIERSNLSRSVLYREADCTGKKLKAEIAAQRVREINPEIKIVTIRGDVMIDVGLGIIRRMDAVIGCLDNRLARLALNRNCYKLKQAWINGGIMNLAGQVNVYKPGMSCYECELTPRDWKHIRFRMGCMDIAKRNSMQGHVPTSPISASVIGAMQVQEAMKLVLEQHEHSLAGKRFYYDGQYNITKRYGSRPQKEGCGSHYEFNDIIEAPEMSANMTIGDALDRLANILDTENPIIELDHTLATGIATLKSKKEFDLVIPQPHLSEKISKQYEEIRNEGVGIPLDKMVEKITREFPHQELKLKDIGIPYLHIMRVKANRKRHFVELTGDEGLLAFEENIVDIALGKFA